MCKTVGGYVFGHYLTTLRSTADYESHAGNSCHWPDDELHTFERL